MASSHKRARHDVDSSDTTLPAKRTQAKVRGQYHHSPSPVTQYHEIDADIEMEELSIPESIPETICYGTIFPSSAQISCFEALKIQPLPWHRFHRFELIVRNAQYHLIYEAENEPDRDIGVLDIVTKGHLDSLEDISNLKFEAVVTSLALKDSGGKPRKKKNKIVDASVNIMGPEALADKVGTALWKALADLQHPVFLQSGIRYINPHWFYPNDKPTDLRHLIGPPLLDSNSKRISDAIEAALGSLDRPEYPNPLTPRLPSGLETWTVQNLRTKLKRHQVDGVKFILSREDITSREELFSAMRALCGPQLFSGIYSLCAGGILADAMGLGKTLTILSTITASKDASELFGAEATQPNSIPRTKATLVITASRQVLDVWVSEIKKHLAAGSVSTTLFHGENRAKSGKELLSHDVVLTTYGTLKSDWKGKGVLRGLCWFRVVLDEAHWIRTQSTQLFKAANELKAERRWCLTGTPIQNSMEDLRSLLKFLQLQPFASRSIFEKHIVQPLHSDCNNGLRNLKILLGAVCLRRNSDYLKLPPLESETISTTLTSEETLEQIRIFNECREQFDHIVSKKNSSLQKYSILFTTILRLRQLCSYGTFRKNHLPLQASTRAKGGEKITDCDLVCNLCSSDDEDSRALLDGEMVCPDCSRPLNGKSTESTGQLGSTPASSISSPGPISPALSLSSDPISAAGIGRQMIAQSSTSKLNAVVENIEQHQAISKSIVFSTWRLTLDALAVMLGSKDIDYVQVDGRVTGVNRQSLLSRFRDEPRVRVLLMSLETGAVGLTLTAATRVHIVEPQWNPSIEEQAIARAHRMGQEKTVTVVRYITQNSVEQKIVERQKRKRRLAKLSLDSHTADDDASGSIEDLKFVLDFGAI